VTADTDLTVDANGEIHLDRVIELAFRGDWGQANLTRICGWLAQEVGDRVEAGSRFAIWSGRGSTDAPVALAAREADVAARGQVLIAACLAGTALGTVGTSIHHALCHLLGGMYDTPHALTHAIVLPYAVKFVRPAVPGAVARLAAAMDTVSEELPAAIWSLGRSVGTPQGLRAIGISESQIEQAVEAALEEVVQVAQMVLDFELDASH